jgi:5-formyltetrahydrofolate cyclo-ligase
MAAPHTLNDLETAKRAARACAVVVRAGCDLANRAVAGEALAQCVLRDYPPPSGAVVSGVWPLGDEIDLRPLMQALHARGHPIVLPVTPKRGQALTFRRWWPGDVLVRERFGTRRTEGEEMVPSFLLVPLLAFDRSLHRLGYGGGYYDRTLAALRAVPATMHAEYAPGRFALGCGYAAQEVDSVPVGPNDVALDAVATERGIIRRMEI